MCIRDSFYVLPHHRTTPICFANMEPIDIRIQVVNENGDTFLKIDKWRLLNCQFETYKWTSICLSFDTRTGNARFVKDGVKIYDTYKDDAIKLKKEAILSPKLILENLRLGSFKECFSTNSFAGKIADFNIWTYPFTQNQSISWTSNAKNIFPENKLVDWSIMNWKLTNFTEEYTDYDTIYKSSPHGPVYFQTK